MFKAVNYFKECHKRKWGSCSGVRTIPCQICFIIPSGKELPSLRFSFKQGHRLRTPGRAWQKMWMPLKETCPRESDVIFWISAQPLVSFLLIQMSWTYRKKSRNCTAIFFFPPCFILTTDLIWHVHRFVVLKSKSTSIHLCPGYESCKVLFWKQTR